jgi:peptidyl-dipeptidase Dcp
MKFPDLFLFAGALAVGSTFFMNSNTTTSVKASSSVETVAAADLDPSTNPLTAPWTGRFGGVPAFDKVRIADFKPALEMAMAEHLREIDAIANNKEKATFRNTILAMEKAGEMLDRVSTVYGIWASNVSSTEFEAVQTEMAPKLAGHGDKITQNAALFRRIETVYNNESKKKKKNGEEYRLTWLNYTNFVRQGAKLGEPGKKRLGEINQELAGHFTRFSQNLLGDEGELFLTITDEKDLAGMPQSYKDSAVLAATAKGKKGEWIIRNTRSSVDPFLTYGENRELREKAWRMFVDRGDNGDERDNNELITKILQLRAERAKLLGYETHAHWRLEPQMAKTPENAMKLMQGVWPAAIARVKEEVADMQALANKENADLKIEPWDYRFYMEKVRKEKFDLDQNEVKPYLQLDNMRDGMFYVADRLFGMTFKQVTGVPVFHPDVTVYEVTDSKNGKHIGLWYFDPYARDGKRSGAWMNAYRSQSRIAGDVTTIVSNNSNFVKGKPGEPVLISWDDATTMFHEFGHALHGLSSNVKHPSLSGTRVARDYVEFPSQLLEHWLSTPEVLQKYALHFETGKPIPQSLVDKIERASTFNQGFATTEYLSSAFVDMKLHLAGSQVIDPDKFERETLAALGMPNEIVMRHRTPQFAHVFSSDGYSAGYYSYLWSDVLTADAFGAFTEAGGPYDAKVGKRLKDNIFSIGNTIDPAQAYRNFRGRDPKVEALMKKRGFPYNKEEN